MSRTHTYTYVVLDVSSAAYEEITRLLRAQPNYQHVFHKDSKGKVVIDMNGIAIGREERRVNSNRRVEERSPHGACRRNKDRRG